MVMVKTTIIDHIATGKAAKAYRKANKVQLRAVALALGYKDGKAGGVVHLESGRTQWNEDIFTKYVVAVDLVAYAGVK